MKRKMLLALAVLTIASTLACNLVAVTGAGPSPTPPPTMDLAATQNAQATVQALSVQATRDALGLQATTAALQATQQALANPPTVPPTRPPARPTQPPAKPTLPLPGDPAFRTRIDQLYEDGKISSKTGDFYKLEDWDHSTAMIGYMQWVTTDYSATNFVLATDMQWSSASKTANWPEAGCGFVFGLQDSDNMTYTYLGLDGFANIRAYVRGNYKNLARRNWGRPDLPEGEASFMLVVNNKRVSLYANDRMVNEATVTTYQPGDIALTVFSGTNKDYGTRCQLTNMQLFIFE
ncbi:MAG: hypothetical protein ACKOC5_04375 [Chloroflexota bacterium]